MQAGFEDLDPSIAEFRAFVRDLGRRYLEEGAFSAARREDHDPGRLLRLLGDHDLLGALVPTEDGGLGLPLLAGVVALEELAVACPATAQNALGVMAGPALFLSWSGTRDQRERFLPGMLAGETIPSISLTEPEAGTALTELTTRAEIADGVCRIRGQKTLCSGAPFADLFLVFVRFGDAPTDIGAVMVPRDTPGLHVGAARYHMSGHQWAELVFDDATVPARDVVVGEHGFRTLMRTYSVERLAGAGYVLGVARLAFELSCEYVRTRRQFGRPLYEFQLVQGHLADMYLDLESSRQLVHRAAKEADDSPRLPLVTSAAKVKASEAAGRITDLAIQLHGGAGQSSEMPLEWLYRIARGYRIAGGTSEIHRSMMAANLLGVKISQR